MNKPLVSVVVITYNSSDYIIEGLESIKEQTYNNLELIISDDCSTDNTVELCRNWLDANKSFFKRSQLITTEKNTGVAGNLNRGVREAEGEWIKTLSGDDKFLPYTIEEYIEYAFNHPEADIIFGKLHFFGPDSEYVAFIKKSYETMFYPKFLLDQKSQYRENLKMLFVPGPGLFYKKTLWTEVGGYDENYPFCEEDPFMFKIFKSGRKIYLLDEEVYGYQVQRDSLGRADHVHSQLTRHLSDRIKFFHNVRKKEMKNMKLFLYRYNETLSYNIIIAKNKNKRILKYMYLILKMFSPLAYITRIKLYMAKFENYNNCI